MKTTFFALMLTALTVTFSSCEDSTNTLVSDPVPTLSADQIEDLTFIREEEKLARDVYLYAFDVYGLNIFNNIASSEQTHMSRMGDLIETYQLEDPVTDDTPGAFNNEELQALYATLTSQVDQSLTEALTVGAIIEDLDIKDLNEALERSTQADVQTAYEMLRCGSGNHIRAFVGQLEQNGATYTPQFLSADEYQVIIEGSHEQCGR